MSKSKRIVLIPAYQPEKEMPEVINELYARGLTVIAVNDGSGAGYDDIFGQIGNKATLLSHEINLGKGEAIKTGAKYIKENFEPPYIVITADADGQHRPEDILKVFDEAEQYPKSLVIGGRRFDGKVPLRSRFGNACTRLVYRLSTGYRIYDTQSGLRAFGDSLIDRMIGINGSRYEYEMNVLMELARSKTDIREVPIKTVYIDNNSSSHFKKFKDSFRIYKEILKFSASSLISFAVDYGLFCILSAVTEQEILSNIIARVFSSILNFTLNKKLVFESKENTAKSAVKYFILAAFILICNTAILKGLTYLGVNRYLAKIITEVVLFSLSFLIQKCFIFKKERRDQ